MYDLLWKMPSRNGVLECYSLIATDSYVLKNKTDVVRAAKSHFLHGTNAALNEVEHKRSKGQDSELEWIKLDALD